MRLYKFRSFQSFDRLLDILVNRRLYCARPDTLNDPFEGVYLGMVNNAALMLARRASSLRDIKLTMRIDSLGEAAGDLRVASLCSKLEDVRLWSHYASGHTGVALEIDIPDDMPALRRVTYVDQLPEVGAGLLAPQPDPVEVLTTKTHHWEYEREYRVIQREGFFELGAQPITVYLGTRVAPEHAQLLADLRLPDVTLVPTILDSHTLRVIPQR